MSLFIYLLLLKIKRDEMYLLIKHMLGNFYKNRIRNNQERMEMMLSFIVGIYRKYQEYVHPGIYVTRHGILYREKGCKYQVSPLHKLMVGKVWTGKIPSQEKGRLILHTGSELIVKGNFDVVGSTVEVLPGGRLILGSGYINFHSKLHCFHHIEVGNQVLISENVIIRDSDNHQRFG